MVRLKDEDLKTLDWIMQSRCSSNSSEGAAWALSAGGMDGDSFGRVGRMLDILNQCPTHEPPADLTLRTMLRIAAQQPPTLVTPSVAAPPSDAADA